MNRTYKPAQVTQPGKLEVVERTMVEPAFGQVRIRVEACGICHTGYKTRSIAASVDKRSSGIATSPLAWAIIISA
jgi:alcohol dehydrogenase, propanol-preferring